MKLSRADVVPLLGVENDKFAFRGARQSPSPRRFASRPWIGRSVACRKSFRSELRPYQCKAWPGSICSAKAASAGVLADDMGLGKTVQILALLALEKAGGNLAQPRSIVAPTSLMTNWFNEAQKFAPDLRVLVLHGPAASRTSRRFPEHDLVLTTYPLIARDREVLLSREWHMAVLDEAQTIKNPEAATTRWLRDIKAQHRFCLTGTPMENHLGELWSIMSFANPGYLGDKAAFAPPVADADREARRQGARDGAGPAGQSVSAAPDQGGGRTELPAKSEIIERIVLEGEQRDLYDSIRCRCRTRFARLIAAARPGQKSHRRARSPAQNAAGLLRSCAPEARRRDRAACGEARPMMEMVLELLSEARKIIVFSQFTSMLDLVRKRLDAEAVRYSVLTGETRDRKRAIDGFQNGTNDVFLVSLKAGGVGLNLTAADTVIIFDPWWNPAVEEQAIDRAHRIGQDKAVFVYRLVAAGTVEEKMEGLKGRKRALADSLFDREGGSRGSHGRGRASVV